ncbi:hypothetical protein PSN45_002815 [Yamadazyma tenuis]|nr:hypothetical protein PSN45_002815 [Yamadazyma tenuis]
MRYANLSQGFQDDLESGLNSDAFNILSGNSNDHRQGLEENAKAAIYQLMQQKSLTFDEARLEYTKSQFGEHNIDSNGVPLDPKTVTFSG